MNEVSLSLTEHGEWRLRVYFGDKQLGVADLARNAAQSNMPLDETFEVLGERYFEEHPVAVDLVRSFFRELRRGLK